MSNVISVRVNDVEQDILNKASALYGCGVSSLIKQIVFEKLEDEYDLKLISEYEIEKSKKTFKTRPISELYKKLDL